VEVAVLQELATGTSAALATASLLFFVAVYTLVVVRVVRARKDDLDAQARLVFDDDEPVGADGGPGSAHLRSE
jgi:hypothetical protein